MSLSPFVLDDDGYFETAFIRAVPHVHADVTFTYRPSTIEERQQVLDSVKDAVDNAKAESNVFEFIARKIKSWQFDGLDSGKTPKVSADMISKLKPLLYDRFRNIVLYGSEGGDDPRGDGKLDGNPVEKLSDKQGN